ncbi:MAG TPA: MoxR family ATPase [Halanaerobiales bacterium]|nr:MoxR family ATPase [Halanaerobiales bacterium]
MNYLDSLKQIKDNINKVIVGKEKSIELLLVALLAEGHVLLEDVPGVGKTLLAKSLARSIGGEFKRVQFTPDLLPADITGFNVYNQKTNDFNFKKGPIVTNILLADEINRTIPRTQASLLESMQEQQITIDGETIVLPEPFLVIATQNPIELEGTYPLPEAQLDRFIIKTDIGYPEKEEEIFILDRFQKEEPLELLSKVIEPEYIVQMQKNRREINIANKIKEFIIDITRRTRTHNSLEYGASPRASLDFMKASQALAMLRGRDYVLPDDIKELAAPVLSHRLVLAKASQLREDNLKTTDIVKEILNNIEVPVIN